MKQPEHYELKQWLASNTITGLRLYYYQTGTDTADTDWELTTKEGETLRVLASTVEPLVRVSPNWVRVLYIDGVYAREVEKYQDFAKREAKDLKEFARLKEKFK